jgi:ubiquinone/menaquinone biosynthesis C-methylase UbiE
LAGLRFYYFLKTIKSAKGSLLEIGCGAGGNLVGISHYKPELELYGVDIGQAAIAYGTNHFPSLHLTVAAAEHLPFGENFAVVCFFDVLEHVEDPATCIKEAVRVLQPGGIFHAYVPCEGELLSFHGLLNACGLNLKEHTAGHIQKLRRRELITFCQNAGLDVIDVKWSCHYLNQIGDLLYYSYLTLTGNRLEHSFESTFQDGDPSFLSRFLGLIKNLVSWIWYWESRMLWFFPGAGVHITARKR